MTMAQMGREMDINELRLQMAYELVEGEDAEARRLGVPTVSDLAAVSPGRRIAATDPDWYAKFERLTIH